MKYNDKSSREEAKGHSTFGGLPFLPSVCYTFSSQRNLPKRYADGSGGAGLQGPAKYGISSGTVRSYRERLGWTQSNLENLSET